MLSTIQCSEMILIKELLTVMWVVALASGKIIIIFYRNKNFIGVSNFSSNKDLTSSAVLRSEMTIHLFDDLCGGLMSSCQLLTAISQY